MSTESTDAETRQKSTGAGMRFLETGLLVAGSALLGGFAVALWHRKSLAKLREPNPAPAIPDADID